MEDAGRCNENCNNASQRGGNICNDMNNNMTNILSTHKDSSGVSETSPISFAHPSHHLTSSPSHFAFSYAGSL